MKVCKNCGIEYSFYGQRSSLCRDCRREYDRIYHASRSLAAKVKKQELQVKRKDEIAQFVYDYFSNNPCTVCGEARVPCLQFDHVGDKFRNVSDMVKNAFSIRKIEEEISKCRVLCANCHAICTAEQCNWYSRLSK